MDKTIQDLLTLARLARQPLRPERVDLGQMAREIIAELTAGELERAIDWVVPDLTVEADAAVARLVLRHLLENAFESTAGRIGARIELGRQADPRGGCLFVRDNGAGFDASSSQRRGEPQQKSDTSGEFLCTGIGLATVARAVRHHGGTLRVESRPGRGAAYYFTLPVPSGRTDSEAA
jgi:signal transduction histidine kinase